MSLVIIDGKIELNKNKQLTPRQLFKLSSFNSLDRKNEYMLSCLGMFKKRLPISKPYIFDKADSFAAKKPFKFLKLLETIKINSSNINHKPLEHGTWIGVEIECLVESANHESAECDDCAGSGCQPAVDENDNETGDAESCDSCDGSGNSRASSGDLHGQIREALKQNKIYRTSVRSDGSVQGENNQVGVEVTILLNTANGFEPLYKLCNILRTQFNASVNKTCGLHVHFDYSKLGIDAAQIAGKRVAKFIPMLAKLQPESRRSNTFCKLSVSKLRGDRYHAVNMTSFSKHGSIEVRLHSGSVDATKIQNWVELLKLIFATPVKGRVTSLQDMLDKLLIKDKLAEYLDERYYKFNPEVAAPYNAPSVGVIGNSDCGYDMIATPLSTLYTIRAGQEMSGLNMTTAAIKAAYNCTSTLGSRATATLTTTVDITGSYTTLTNSNGTDNI